MRSTWATLLVLLASLLAPFAIGSTWVAARVADEESYVDRVGPLADDPVVRSALADASAAAAVDAIQKYVPITLPDALEEWARAAATMVVESPEFPRFWRNANQDVHRQATTLLGDADDPADGSITIDASELVAQVLLGLEERGIPVGLLPQVPLEVPVVTEAKVAEAGPAYRLGETMAKVLPLVWLALVALAVLVAVGTARRVRTLGLALLGVGVAAVLVLLAVEPLSDLVVEQAELSRREIVGVVVDALTGSLSPYARWFLVAGPVGLLLIVGSWWPRRRGDFTPEQDWNALG